MTSRFVPYLLRLLCLCLLAFNAYAQDVTTFANSPSPATLTEENATQRDLQVLGKLLKESHPKMLEESFAISLDSELAKFYQLAKHVDTPSDSYLLLQQFTSLMGDGHTTLALDTALFKTYYPIRLGIEEYPTVRLMTAPKIFQRYVGKEIKSICDIPILDVVDTLRRYISADNVQYSLSQVSDLGSFCIYWRSLGLDTLKVTFADMDSIFISPISVSDRVELYSSPKAMHYNTLTAPRKALYWYDVMAAPGVAYLQMNAMKDYQTEYSRITTSKPSGYKLTPQEEAYLSSLPRFSDFIDQMFQEMDSLHTHTLIIDLRYNSGGNSMLGDMLLQYLPSQREDTSHYTYHLRVSELWRSNYPSVSERIPKAYSGKMIDGKTFSDLILTDGQSQMSCDQSHTPRRTFKGDVYIFVGEKTFSSAGMLATVAQDAGVALILEDASSPCAFAPCHYGDVIGFTLPNSGFKGYTSSKSFVRPDQTRCGEKRLVTDRSIPQTKETSQLGADPLWEYVINTTSETKE